MLIKQQQVRSFLCGNFRNIILVIVLSAAFLGIANVVHTMRPANAATASVSNSNVQSIINNVFGADAPAAKRVAMCESSNNPNAVNPTIIGNSRAEGLFQILAPSTWYTTSQAGSSPFNATANTIAAHDIFVRDGHSWREWGCQP